MMSKRLIEASPPEEATSKPVAYSYIRISTDEQVKGDGARRQLHLSERYAKEHGLDLDTTFRLRDQGVSAFHGANVESGDLGRFLAAAKSGLIRPGSFLLVESLDRITRQRFRESVRLFLDITDAGINVVTVADGQVYRAGQTRLDELLMPFLIMSRANEESEIKSFRLSKAWEEKRRRSSEEKLTSICPKWLTLAPDRKSFSVIDERVAVVRQIFEWATQGAGTHMIVRRLNDLGIPPFGGGSRWGSSSVTKLLNNRAVLGEYQPHKKQGGQREPVGEPLRDYFPRVIDDDLFLRAQIERRDRSTKGGGRVGPHKRNLFTHLATCTFCGSPMYLVNKGPGPKGGIYLRCRQAAAGGPCDAAGWPYADFEKSFFFFVREADLASAMSGSSSSVLRKLQDDIRLCEARSASLEEQRDRTFSLIEGADFDSSFVRGKLADIEAKLASEHASHAELVAKRGVALQVVEAPAKVLELISDLQSDSSSIFDKRVRLASHLKTVVRSMNIFCRRQPGSGFSRGFVVTFYDGSARTVQLTDDPLIAEYHFRLDQRPQPDFVDVANARQLGVPS